MIFELFDHSKQTLDIWENNLSEAVEVRCFRADKFSDVADTSKADAFMMPVVMAHEWFGGVPIVGRAQVLTRENWDEVPKGIVMPWERIVTTVPFPVEIERIERDGIVHYIPKPKLDVAVHESTRLLFKGVLRAVEDFNDFNDDKVDKICINLSLVGFDKNNAQEQSRGAVEALFEHEDSRFSRVSSRGSDAIAPPSVISFATVERVPAPVPYGGYSSAGSGVFEVSSFYLTRRFKERAKQIDISIGAVIDGILLSGFLSELQGEWGEHRVSIKLGSLGSKTLTVLLHINPIRKAVSLRNLFLE